MIPDRSRLSPLLREHRHAPAGGRQDEDRPGGEQDPRDGSRDRGRSRAPEDNPYAPPPEGTPDRPWQPRPPTTGVGGTEGSGSGGPQGSGSGDGGRAPWGSQWSDRQPGRAPGGFGERPDRRERPEQGGPDGPSGPGLRWDPSDPAQRRGRYALLSGMWAFFFSLFGWRDLALLLGVLAVYWGVSALRGGGRRTGAAAGASAGSGASAGAGAQGAAGPGGSGASGAAGGAARPGLGGEQPAQARQGTGAGPQTTAAATGLVTAGLALVMVAMTYTAQLVYQDYYTCVNDALTTSAKHSCEHLLPKDLRSVLSEEP